MKSGCACERSLISISSGKPTVTLNYSLQMDGGQLSVSAIKDSPCILALLHKPKARIENRSTPTEARDEGQSVHMSTTR